MVAEHCKRVQTIEAEIRDVKKQLDRIWRYIATRDDVDVAKTSARMAEYQDRQSVSRTRRRTRERCWPSTGQLWATPAKLRNTPERWTTSWIGAN